MSMPGLSSQTQMHQGVPSFDLGHGLGQQHRLLLARAGSDPTTALTHIPGEALTFTRFSVLLIFSADTDTPLRGSSVTQALCFPQLSWRSSCLLSS